jgi:hypothetical protein
MRQKTEFKRHLIIFGLSLAALSLGVFPTLARADVMPPGMIFIQFVGDSFGVHPTLWNYFQYFFWTCVIESPFYFYALRDRSWKQRILAVVALNVATHPLVYFGTPWVALHWHCAPIYSVIIGEVLAVFVEAILLYRIRKSGTFLAAFNYSFFANFASFIFGFFYTPFPHGGFPN